MFYNPYRMTFSISDIKSSLNDMSIAQIDAWLNEIFLCNISHDSSDNHDVKAVIYRVLRLSICLLQGIKIPIFHEGEILCISYDEVTHNYDVTVSLDYIDYIPPKVYDSALGISVQLTTKLLIQAISKDTIANLHAIIEENFYYPCKNFSGSSKSTLPILQTAHKLDIPYRRLASGIYQLGWGKRSIWLSGSSINSDSKIGAQIVGNKMLTAILLKDAGLPYPIHKLIRKKEECILAAKKLAYPLVVKPTDENAGRGVVVNIDNDSKLLAAFDEAMSYSKSGQILLEKQVKGVCHRIFIVKQKVLYVVKRWPKSILGNGQDTVKELIHKLNYENMIFPVWLRVEYYPLDGETEEVLSSYGYTLDTILKKDEWMPLRYIESGQYGGRNEDVTRLIHPENIEIALRAASLFGMEVAGIDIISEDISIPWYENDAIINEVNFSPQLGRDATIKKHIPTYLKSIITNNGRIPITVIIGKENALQKAISIQQEKIQRNVAAFLSSHEHILNSSGINVHHISKKLAERVNSLFLHKDMEELIIVVQNDDVLMTKLPIDKVDALSIIEEDAHLFNVKTLQFFKNLVDER